MLSKSTKVFLTTGSQVGWLESPESVEASDSLRADVEGAAANSPVDIAARIRSTFVRAVTGEPSADFRCDFAPAWRLLWNVAAPGWRTLTGSLIDPEGRPEPECCMKGMYASTSWLTRIGPLTRVGPAKAYGGLALGFTICAGSAVSAVRPADFRKASRMCLRFTSASDAQSS